MKIASVLEVITAAHLSKYVDCSPKMSVRGGLMLVAPPASLKSTILNQLEVFPNALVLSDTNVRQIMELRDDIANGEYSTVALLELGKIYQRQDTTSSNVEGHLAAMVDEGFKHTGTDQRMVVRVAKCFLAAGMTSKLYHARYTGWQSSGFARRFVWCHYILKDRQAIVKAIHAWKPLEIIPDMIIFGMPKGEIPYSLTESESGQIRKFLRHYKEIETPFILLKKVACVLKWRHSDRMKQGNGNGSDQAMGILTDFAESLTSSGGEMTI